MAVPKKLPRVLTDDEAKALIDVFNLRYDAGVKNRCLVRVMLEAGLRVSEAVSLRPAALDMQSCRLVVKDGKGGKDRVLWISEDLRDLVGRWKARRPESTWLFPTRTGNKTSPRSLRRTVKTYAHKAAIVNADEISPHTLIRSRRGYFGAPATSGWSRRRSATATCRPRCFTPTSSTTSSRTP